MIDTHANLDFPQFNDDLDYVIKRADDAGVSKIINIGCDPKRSEISMRLSQKYPNIYYSVGIHPDEAKNIKDIKSELEKLKQYILKKTVAIGEIGLDYFKLSNNNEKAMQKKLLDAQIDFANEINLPIIFHCREAYEDLINILRQKSVKRGVVHCFTGNSKQANNYINLGMLISFTGIITYPNTEELNKAVENIPIDKMMVETDCPFLAPQAYRGQRNEPAYVAEVAKQIAKIKNISVQEVEAATDKTVENFFYSNN